MLGHRTKRFKLFNAANLDALVPADHFYRQLEEKLDLSFVRAMVRDRYEEIGRPSIDPVVFFKLHLIAFFERIASERRLMETAHLNLAHRWYLGYDLDDPLPDHSSLSKIRSRYGVEGFQRFFEAVVERCKEAGLVDGDELYFDATQVEANAAISSLVPRGSPQTVQEHVLQLFAQNPVPDQKAQSQNHSPTADDYPTGGTPGSSAANAEESDSPTVLSQLMEKYRERQRSPLRKGKSTYRRMADAKVSRTDPDAQPQRGRAGGRLGYHDQYVVDGGKARIILATLVTSASVMENSPMLDLARWVRFRWRLRPKQATGDTTYATLENIKGLEDDGIKAYVPLADWARRPGLYGPQAFTYLADRDAYLCPQGQLLFKFVTKRTEHAYVYQGHPEVCNACPVKSRCTTSNRGRTIQRPFDQEYIDRVRAYHETEAYKRAIRKRKVWVEPLFGEAKVFHGLRRFRLRGLAKVNMEGLMVAAGQNLKRLLGHLGTRRWPIPTSGRLFLDFSQLSAL
jgi:transposase